MTWATAVQLAGLVLLAAGLGMLAVWLGVAVLGAGLLLVGVALEVGDQPRRPALRSTPAAAPPDLGPVPSRRDGIR